MKHHRLDDMVKGWFVGNFSPVAFRSQDSEVAIKYYTAGDKEATHYHKRATEVTVIVSGIARMLGREWSDGDIITIEPFEATSFEALTDVTTVVVKYPSAPNDKYMADE